MTSKFALQKVLIRLTVPKEEADKSYKSITKRKPRKTKDYAEFRHYRFLPPTKFISRSFRTKVVNDDIRLVFGLLKPEHDKLEGAGLFDYFTKAYDYVSNKVSNALDYIKQSVSITDYSTTTKALLEQYGNLPVVQIVIRREPLDIALELALQGVSSGKWLELKKKHGFDAFYHLSMVVTIGGAVQRVMKSGRVRTSPKKLAIEKLAVISINEKVDITPDMETLDVPITSKFTIRDMFDKAREKYGDTRFFSYSALGNNNCQNFIQMLLEVEGLYTEPVKNFVFQDLTQLVKELPESTAFISQGITHLGALANKYLGIGGGMDSRMIGGFRSQSGVEITLQPDQSLLLEHRGRSFIMHPTDGKEELHDYLIENFKPASARRLFDAPAQQGLLHPLENELWADILEIRRRLLDARNLISSKNGDSKIGDIISSFRGAGVKNVKIPKGEFVKEHTHLIDLLKTGDRAELKKEATIQAKELKKMGRKSLNELYKQSQN